MSKRKIKSGHEPFVKKRQSIEPKRDENEEQENEEMIRKAILEVCSIRGESKSC
jgi:hypothetical protein